MMTLRFALPLLLLFAPALVRADLTPAPAPPETLWPIEVQANEYALKVYQPQIDAWDGHALKARAAVSATQGTGEKAATTYGILHVTADTFTDKGSRTVTLSNYAIAGVDFPTAPQKDRDDWIAALKKEASGRTKVMSLDRLEALLGTAGVSERTDRKPLANEAPTIVFSTVPAMLIYVDGKPAYQAVSGTSLERIVNARPLVLRKGTDAYYIHVFDGWMTATTLEGSYEPLVHPSEAVAAELEKAKTAAIAGRQVDLLVGQAPSGGKAPSLATPPVPVLLVVTRPTELIVTDGGPEWVPIENTELMYASNTTGNVFKDVPDQKTYVLVSGRWFRASKTDGPWEFVAANALPDDFANIPDDSPKENVKASVAGTAQALEAAIEAEVPQTAAIKKSATKMTPPTFDGKPKLEPIEGTPLEYVVNTATPIVKVGDTSFFAVENGIWFAATSVNGPWAVASSVPAIVYLIPPSSSLYYATFVRIFSATDDTVVVGYTPGYHGTYVDPVTGVVVFGTGYPYAPWVGSVWYGPPVTYGFGVSIRYTPWTGWTFGFGFGWSWGGPTLAVGWGWGAYPWWGPYGWGYCWGPHMYPAPYYWGGAAYGYHGGAVAWGPGGWAGTTGNIYSQWGSRATVSRYSSGYDAWTGNAWATRVGTSYNSRTGVASAGQRGAVQNVYTGNYASASRGVATGPGGTTAAGRAGTVGNAYTGHEVQAGQAVVHNPYTGQSTTLSGVRGNEGSAARVGDDVYAGHDGNVYRHTDTGWQVHGSDGWSNTQASTRLDTESTARSWGGARAQGVQSASSGMSGGFGGGRNVSFGRR